MATVQQSTPPTKDTKANEGGGMGSMIAITVLGLVCLALVATTAVLATRDVECDGGGAAPLAIADSKPAAAEVTVDLNFQTVGPSNNIVGANPCAGKKPDSALTGDKKYLEGEVTSNPGFDNLECRYDATVQAVEQAGADVTKGYKGQKQATMAPQTSAYWKVAMCPVNVHWHLGAEHRSEGEFDENGKGPADKNLRQRQLAAGKVRKGLQCHHYDEDDAKFTTPFNWEHCVDMKVGQTYEVHWPHSAAGDCGTPHQYQSPFYDGVFCNFPFDDAAKAGEVLGSLASLVGVQAQVFTIVNDENYYYPDLMRGMIRSGDFGADVAIYTGSTTGTSRNNEVCSAYGPITWQVDRKCHMISASSFDKMCADMKTQNDDMSMDLHAHGSRELVADDLTADNLQDAPGGYRRQ